MKLLSLSFIPLAFSVLGCGSPLDEEAACPALDLVCEEDQDFCDEDEIDEDYCLEITRGEGECEMTIYCKSSLIVSE